MASNVNATTFWTPQAGYLANAGQIDPEEQKRIDAANQAQQPSPYIQGGTVQYPGGSSPANPTQFATPEEAARLAALYGGTSFGQDLTGPGYAYSDPQQQLSIPGAPSPLNAGLVSGALNQYGGKPGDYGSYLVARDIDPSIPDPYAQRPNSPSQMDKYATANGWDNATRARFGIGPIGSQFSTALPGKSAAPSSGPGSIQRPTPAGPGTPQTPPRTSIYNSALTPGGLQQSAGQPQTANAVRSRGGINLGSAGTDNPTADPNAGYSQINTGYWPDNFMSDAGWTQDANGQWVNSQPWTQAGLPQYGDPNGEWSQDPTTGQWIQGQGVPAAPGAGNPPAGRGTGGGSATPGPGTGFPPSGPGFPPSGTSRPPGGPPQQNASGAPRATNPYLNEQDYAGTGAGWSGNTLPGRGRFAWSPYYSANGEDIQYRAENDRNMAIAQGLGLQGDLSSYTNYQQGRAGDYENAANTAYGGIASGYGGRTDEEKAAIQQQPALNAMQLSDEQQNANYLTDEEKGTLHWEELSPEEGAAAGIQPDASGKYYTQKGVGGISGDPYAPYRQLGLDEASIDASTNSRTAAVRGAYGAGASGINSGLTGTASGVRNAIYDNRGKQYQNLSDAAALTRGAQSDAASNVRGALNYGEDTTRSYVDPSKLGLSDQYKNDYNFGERDVQNLRDKAGRDIGSQEAMDTERLMAGANANGNVSPLAIAAQRAKIRQQSAVNQANAMSDAEIAGKKLQLDTTQQKENTRLGAESNYANLGTGTELALGGRRAGAEQTLGAQNLSNEQNLTGETLATQNTLAAAEQGAEQYLGNQKQQAEQFKTATNVSAEQALGAAGTEAEKFKTSTNLGAGQTAEQAQSQRANQIATNRQATNVGNQQSALGRQQYAYGATAQNNTDFSNQRRADEGEYRGYLTGQGTQANQNAQVGNQQRLSAYGTQLGAQNASTGNAIKNYGTPSGDSVTGAYGKLLGIGKFGGVSKGPQEALVGEAGPELIVDIGVPHYGGGSDIIDPYAQQDFYAQGGADGPTDPYGATTMTGPRPSNAQIRQTATIRNPLWEKIKRGIGDYQQQQADGGQQQQSPNSGILGLAMKALPMLLSHGGVVKPGANQHHPYGKRGMPHAELVTHPQIRTLGQYGAQAVVPLRHRPGNRVNVEDIPELERQYAGYGA